MKKRFLFISIIYFLLTTHAFSQTLSLSIRPIAGASIAEPNQVKVFLGEVDALGISPNRFGEVHYDRSRKGAFYDIPVEITTEIIGNTSSPAQLSVIRTRAVAYDDIPSNAIFDADYPIKFGEGSDIHLIDENRPYMIRSDLPAQLTRTLRKVGILVSESLTPGLYRSGVIYTLSVP